MYKASVRRAYYGVSPHMWPFYLWWWLIKWSMLSAVAVIGFFYVAGDIPFELSGFVIFAYSIGVGAALFGLVPAALLTLLDVLLVRRPSHRPANFDPPVPRYDRQHRATWMVTGAITGAGFALGYSVVYLNAFAPQASLRDLVFESIFRLAIGGAATAWLTAAIIDAVHRIAPARAPEQQMGRGAVIWVLLVLTFGLLAFATVMPTLELTVLPAGLLAFVGAVVIPQVATTPPVDLRTTPPPAMAVPAPSSRLVVPEGGAGEGAGQVHPAAPAAPTSSIGHHVDRRKDDQWTTP